MGCCKAKCIRGRATVAGHNLNEDRSSQQVGAHTTSPRGCEKNRGYNCCFYEADRTKRAT